MNKKKSSVLIVNMILLSLCTIINTSAQNLSNENFQINQKIDVTFKSGKTIQLFDFVFYSKHAEPEVWLKNETLSKPICIMVNKGDQWKTFKLSDINSLDLYPILDNYKWVNAVITLIQGDTILGEIPVSPHLTWVNGDEFRFSGVEKNMDKDKISYRTIDIKLSKIKRLERSSDNNYILIEKNGKEHNFTSTLEFITYGQNSGQFYRYSCINHIGSTIHLIINSQEKTVDVQDIQTIFFDEKGTVLRIIMKDAAELKGKIKHLIYNLFGKLDFNKIWFGPIKDSIESIYFY